MSSFSCDGMHGAALSPRVQPPQPKPERQHQQEWHPSHHPGVALGEEHNRDCLRAEVEPALPGALPYDSEAQFQEAAPPPLQHPCQEQNHSVHFPVDPAVRAAAAAAAEQCFHFVNGRVVCLTVSEYDHTGGIFPAPIPCCPSLGVSAVGLKALASMFGAQLPTAFMFMACVSLPHEVATLTAHLLPPNMARVWRQVREAFQSSDTKRLESGLRATVITDRTTCRVKRESASSSAYAMQLIHSVAAVLFHRANHAQSEPVCLANSLLFDYFVACLLDDELKALKALRSADDSPGLLPGDLSKRRRRVRTRIAQWRRRFKKRLKKRSKKYLEQQQQCLEEQQQQQLYLEEEQQPLLDALDPSHQQHQHRALLEQQMLLPPPRSSLASTGDHTVAALSEYPP